MRPRETSTIANIAYQYIILRDDDIAALKIYGMVEDEGQLGLGFRISRAIKEEARGNNWTMPDNIVRRDQSGRLILVGNPRTHYELAEQIARVL